MNYGVPYKGSKNGIAPRLIDILPSADCFVDLFAGGCAMTHAALLSGKYKRAIINDIDPMPTSLFLDAINGKFKDEKRCISREDFKRLKASDPYVKCCWSFGNNGSNYLWGKEIEDIKLLACKIILADDRTERRKMYKNFVRFLCHTKTPLHKFKNLQSLESLERLQSLEPKITRYCVSYSDVPIPDGATVYCDPPYKGTEEYGDGGFNSDEFFDWALRQEFPVFISEYAAPSGFTCIYETKKTCRYSVSNKGKKTIEKLFVQDRFVERCKPRQMDFFTQEGTSE